ncbi:MAG: hypothetical protein D6820_16230 [Lentisphaerae bacterium]|nr:MAG: hypothetical protein D6820_16230 [Lentisphaerota bacterium]
MSMKPLTVALSMNDHKNINRLWNMGANTCHGALWLRSDLQRHMRMAKRDLAFRYIRCHGLLNDDLGVVSPQGTFNFEKLHRAIQAVLDIGLKPFFEISSMPGFLASNDKSITRYTFRSAPPKDWQLWYRLIHELTQSLVHRFGEREIRTWYFEVWNEPDIAFWSGTREEYFRLYDLCAQAIKSVNPGFRVGGPATARTNWIKEFLEHVTTPSPDYTLTAPRCDFISTHAYPSDVEFLDAAHGDVCLQSSDLIRTLFRRVRELTDAYLGPETPVIIGEWNSSAGPLAANHDNCNNGAFVAKIMHDLQDLCQGSLYWNLSDIYEECGFHYTPFHGGYGLYTVNDLPKAAAHAFRMLNTLEGPSVTATYSETIPGIGIIGCKTPRGSRLLAYYYEEPDKKDCQPEAVELIFPGWRIIRCESVEPGAGSAYETWLTLGSPDYINRDILQQLEMAACPRILQQPPRKAVNIQRGTFALLELEPADVR